MSMVNELDNQAVNFLLLTLALMSASFLLGAKLTRRNMHSMIATEERHYSRILELAKAEWEMDFDMYERKRLHVERRESYEKLAAWLIRLDRTLEEIYEGAVTSQEQAQAKLDNLLQGNEWRVIAIPTELAYSEFYWSSEIHALIRGIQLPYSSFLVRLRTLQGDRNRKQELGQAERGEIWDAKSRTLDVLADIRQQARVDLRIS